MEKMIKRIICGLLMAFLLVGSFNITSYAASDYPEVFDFGDTTLKINAGETKEVWVQSKYNYVCYVGDHSSKGTYIETSCKKGSEYVKIHIGADETVKNVFFFFYVDEDPYKDGSKYAGIEVYVQGIQTPVYDPVAESLKSYTNNNAAFNAYYYYMNYADLRLAFGANPDALLQHYLTYGVKEGRIANKIK